MPITEITERQLDLFVKHRLAQGVGTTTVNRQVGYLLQALRRAMRKKLLTELPIFEKFSEKDNARQGFFTQEDFERIVPFLPDDLQGFVRFAYYSGWRKGEITQLEWRDVHDGVIRLRPQIAKNKDGRMLALVGAIGEIITRRRAVQRPETPWFSIGYGTGKSGRWIALIRRGARPGPRLGSQRPGFFTTFDAPPCAI
jgi:integrase